MEKCRNNLINMVEKKEEIRPNIITQAPILKKSPKNKAMTQILRNDRDFLLEWLPSTMHLMSWMGLTFYLPVTSTHI